MDITELDPSELGTRKYWQMTYIRELENYVKYGDGGEVWFGEDCANRVIDWFCKAGLEKGTAVLDIGSGNGHTLSALGRLGFANLTGVDYCQDAITLAENVTKPEFPDIKYKNFDIIQDSTKELGKFGIVHDKGTYDAIGLNPEDPKRCREKYIDQVHDLLQEEGRKRNMTQLELSYEECRKQNIKQILELLDEEDEENNLSEVEKLLDQEVRECNITEDEKLLDEEDREQNVTEGEKLLDEEVRECNITEDEKLLDEEVREYNLTGDEKLLDEEVRAYNLAEDEKLLDDREDEVREYNITKVQELDEEDSENNITKVEKLLDEEDREHFITEVQDLSDKEDSVYNITEVEKLLDEEPKINIDQVGDMKEERRNYKCKSGTGSMPWKITEIDGMKCIETVEKKEFRSYLSTLYPKISELVKEGTKAINECKEMRKERRKVIDTVEGILKEERAKEVKDLKEEADENDVEGFSEEERMNEDEFTRTLANNLILFN